MSNIINMHIHEMSSQFLQAESYVIAAVAWLRLAVETMGAIVIAIGIVMAAIGFAKVMIGNNGESFRSVRLTLARYLALALEFQLGADILSTAIAPSWDQIGKLGAIAIIRTALNYFLMHEMAMSKQEQEKEAHGEADRPR
ncbi:MAG: DUF1622 domain-containing protein [Chromatiales bacterium]|nr:DUF1622 domain-containing protein [Chromatiales bacterium]